jgi:hypothetical protein
MVPLSQLIWPPFFILSQEYAQVILARYTPLFINLFANYFDLALACYQNHQWRRCF